MQSKLNELPAANDDADADDVCLVANDDADADDVCLVANDDADADDVCLWQMMTLTLMMFACGK